MTEESAVFLPLLRDFLSKESPPELVHEQDERKEPPLDLLRRLGELGYLSVGLPDEWGGAGSVGDLVRMMEEIAYHNLALGHLVGRTIYIEQLLLHFGTQGQRERWIPGLREGRS